MRGILLAAVLTVATVTIPAIAQQPEIAQARLGGFKTQTELDQKFSRIKKGWTRAQVHALLGKPQWGNSQIYNYFIQNANGGSAGLERALEFNSNGVVVKLGGGAG